MLQEKLARAEGQEESENYTSDEYSESGSENESCDSEEESESNVRSFISF